MTGSTSTKVLTSSSRILTGPNPFGVPERFDLLQPVQPDVPHYSETMYFPVCDRRHEGLGLFLHMGRVSDDLELWWARTIAYLPGGRVVMARTFGRAPDDRGPATGNLAVRCEQEHRRWRLSFDGAGELTTREATGQGLSGEGAAVPLRFDVELTSISPVWDLEAACGISDPDPNLTSWASRHQQQAFLADGTITAAGQRWELDAVAYRDHSWGPRDVSGFGGDAFATVIFPESRRVACGMVIYGMDGQPNLRTFYISEGDQLELIEEGEVPWATDTLSNPRTGLEFSLRRHTGELVVLRGEVLNGATTTVLEPNRNLNGAALGRADALVLNEDIVRYTWPDGEVGYGHSERGIRPTAR